MCKGEFEILEVDYEKKVVYFDKYGAYKDICYTDPEILLSHAGFETINIL
jgi:calcineurin-like phosphoesterase family protein